MTQDQIYHGYYKLVEEMGEALTDLGKLGPFPTGDHPDGKGPALERVSNELVDVEAAIQYFREVNGLSGNGLKFAEKLTKFRKWGLTGISPKPDQK